MSIIKEEMPLLVRHEGEWEGNYKIIDNNGNLLDEHRVNISVQFPENSPYACQLVYKYQWDNGKFEEHYFLATYRDQKIWFDTERLQGYAWEADDSIVLIWFTYKSSPDISMYEIIQLSPCGNYRYRTMHLLKNHQVFKLTLMQEQRVN